MLLMLACIPFIAFSQENGGSAKDKEEMKRRFEARQAEFMTRELNLTAEEGQRFYGSSFIANHRGDKVEELDRDAEGVIVHRFDLNFLHRHRAAWGFFRDRRPELYGPLATADGKLRV